MGDERRINQLTAKAYDNIGSSDYFAVDNASEAESKKLPASSIKTPISNLQGEVTGGSDTYSSTKNYSVGMYATHTTGGVQKLYRCKTACTAAVWTTNASCFEEANLADAVSQLNNDLIEQEPHSLHAFSADGVKTYKQVLEELTSYFPAHTDLNSYRLVLRLGSIVFHFNKQSGVNYAFSAEYMTFGTPKTAAIHFIYFTGSALTASYGYMKLPAAGAIEYVSQTNEVVPSGTYVDLMLI